MFVEKLLFLTQEEHLLVRKSMESIRFLTGLSITLMTCWVVGAQTGMNLIEDILYSFPS